MELEFIFSDGTTKRIKFTGGTPIVPRVGDYVVIAGTKPQVTMVFWDYDELCVFVHLKD